MNSKTNRTCSSAGRAPKRVFFPLFPRWVVLLAALVLGGLLASWLYWPQPVPSPVTVMPAVIESPGKEIESGSPRIAESEPQPEPELSAPPAPAPPAPAPTVATEQRDFALEPGQALVGALQDRGVSRQQAGRLALALDEVYQARKLRAGQAFDLTVTTDTDEPLIQSLAFSIGLDQQIVVEQGPEGFVAEERAVPHIRKVEARTLIVSGSLAGAAAQAGVPQEAILEIVQQLGYRIDFNQDLREGDRIDLTYERFLHPEDDVEHTGALLSARLKLSNRDSIEIYRYETSDGITSFYDKKGVSIETELARTPVVGGFLTSNYGPREHPVLKVLRMHKGMDFAAPKGAAVIAVRAGKVIKARRNGSFGKYIRLNHGKGLETAYAHLSKYETGLAEGSWVEQGAIIGYVGESGLATSPNLHYEVLRNGRQVDPRAVDLPPRLMLRDSELARFQEFQQELQTLFSEQDSVDESGRS